MKLTVKFAGIFAVLAFALTAVSADAAFTRDLTLGSTGTDVTELQNVLISAGYSIPAGATGYFGAQTQSALAKWQASVGIVPAAGYFGPITRAKLAMSGTPSTPDDNGSDNGSDDLSGGEASLESYDFSSGDDSDVEEGNSGDVAEIEFDVEDGDIIIDRIDFALVGSSTEEEDPWDAFDSITLSVDGDEIAEMDLSDEGEYLDEDDGTFRVSGIDYKVAEGETVNIVVSLTAQNSVDGADNNDSTWTINVETDGVRATDGEGIQQYIGTASEEVEFEVVEAGDGEELNVSTSNDDPESATLEVMDDEKSDSTEIFVFDLEAEESDVEINTVTLALTSNATVTNVIHDLVLEIDGEEFDDWSYVTSSSTTTKTVEFDIDGDYTLDADSEVAVVLKAEFKAANGSNYNSGATIAASITTAGVEGEGQDDIDSTGTATGDTHTLSTEGIMVELSSKEADSTGTDDKVGEFTFVVDVTAFEEDTFVELSAFRGTTETNTGFNIVILDGSNAVVSTGTTTFSVEADEDETSNGRVEVSEGDTVQFTVTAFLDAATAGTYKAQLYSVNHNTVTDADADVQFLAVPESTYRTASTYVEN